MLSQNIQNINFNDLETSLIILILTLISTAIVYILTPKLARLIEKYTDKMDSASLIRLLRLPLVYTSIYIGIWFFIQLITLSTEFVSLINSLTLTLGILLWSRTLYMFGRKIIKSVIKYRYDENIVPIALNIWTLSMLVFGVLFVFEVWDINITPILASAGVFGIVIGLAARETISNFFGSIALYADNTYQKGDYIRTEDSNSEGFVKDISIRSTQLQTLDNNIITIPNSQLHKSVIENKSEPSKSQRIELEIGISYNQDPDKVRNIINQCISDKISGEDSMELNSVSNYKVFVKEFGDSAVIYRIYLWIKHPSSEPNVRDKIQSLIYDTLDEKDIDIPYPKRSVEIKEPQDSDENNIDNINPE